MKNKANIFKYLSLIFSVACMGLMIVFAYDRQTSTASWGMIAFLWAVLFHLFYRHNKKKGEDPLTGIKRHKR